MAELRKTLAKFKALSARLKRLSENRALAAPSNPQDSSGMGSDWFSIADVHTEALGGYCAALLPRPDE
jgi:hypothetical protein